MYKTTSPLILAATLGLTACGSALDPLGGVSGAYEGSRFVAVNLLSYQPRHLQMVGNVPQNRSASVTVIRQGTKPYEVTLPHDCPEGPIRARLGTDVRMREDSYRQEDGTIRTIVSNEEMRNALCVGLTPQP